jgi:hypothetical protein
MSIRRKVEAMHHSTSHMPLGIITKKDIILTVYYLNHETQKVAGMKKLPNQKTKAFVTKIHNNGYFTVSSTHFKLNDLEKRPANDIMDAVYLAYRYGNSITLTPKDMRAVIDPEILEGTYYRGIE